MKSKNRILPIILTLMILVIIVYLFINIKQPIVECEKTITTDSKIVIDENLTVTFSRDKIAKMELIKTITLPEKYQNNETIDKIKERLQKAYKYLNSKKSITVSENNIIIKVNVSDDETILLNNLDFYENPALQIKIDSNTKSSNVITLKIKDKYTEGEFMTRLKKNGYVCK